MIDRYWRTGRDNYAKVSLASVLTNLFLTSVLVKAFHTKKSRNEQIKEQLLVWTLIKPGLIRDASPCTTKTRKITSMLGS